MKNDVSIDTLRAAAAGGASTRAPRRVVAVARRPMPGIALNVPLRPPTAITPARRAGGKQAPARAVDRRLAQAVDAAWPWLVPAFVVALWQLASTRGWMPVQVLPPPVAVVQALIDFGRSGELLSNVAISAWRIGLGSALGAGLGLTLGVLLGLSGTARAYLEPFTRALFAVPSLGWIPVLILIFGIDETLKVLIIAKAVLVPVVISTSEGIRQVPVSYLEVGRVLRLGRWTRLFRLVLLASLPGIVSGLRLGMSHAFIALIVVEMLAATEGLGYMMVWGRKLFQLDIVMASMLVVGVVGFALDRTLRASESALARWAPSRG